MFNFIKEIPITITIAVLTVLAFLMPSVAGMFEFSTVNSLVSQIPQIFGCHLLHWSFDHLSWDLFMFVLVGSLCERRSQIDFSFTLLLSSILIPVCVAIFAPSVTSYRGLSGIDTALFSYAALIFMNDSWKEKNWNGVWIYGILFAGMLLKTAYECAFGGTLFVDSGTFSPVPIAHIVGGAIGAFVAGLSILRRHPAVDERVEHAGVL